MILIMGYGNVLRSDDGIGHVVAQQMGQRLSQDNNELCVYLMHQLTPELVVRIAGASYVIFIDAREGGTPGTIACETVSPQIAEGVFTHNTNPAALLGTAREWYGSAVQGLLISVVGASFEYGDALSHEMNVLLPTLLDEVEHLIKSHINTVEA